MKKRGEDGVAERQARRLVGDQARHVIRPLGVNIGDGRETARGLDDVVEGRTRAVRAVLPEPRRHAIDDVRFFRAQGLVAETETLDRLDAHVVDEDVGATHQFSYGVAAFVLFQVDRERALVAVDGEKDRTQARRGAVRLLRAVGAHQIAFERFYLDDVGAVVAEDLRRQRAEHDRRHVHDAHARKRAAWLVLRLILRQEILPSCAAVYQARRVMRDRTLRARVAGPV